jgi:pimeloyl-ACP methyl ester carboxylesterase
VETFAQEMFADSAIIRCRELLSRSARLDLYTTPLAVEDLDELRQALGYDKIHLHGASYGSVTALEYLRRYPHAVRTATLAGVATPAAKLPLQFAEASQRALERLFADCAADADCHGTFPELRRDFEMIQQAISDRRVKFTRTDPHTKQPQILPLMHSTFAERLRLMLYNHESSRLLPLMIHRAAHGDWSLFTQPPATANAAPFGIAFGAYFTITCAESAAIISEDEIRRRTAQTFMGDYRVRRHHAACAHWPRGEIPDEYYLPVHSDVPILMLSGEIDPATPPEYGAKALDTLPNGRQIILHNTPHSYGSSCARELTVKFIASGDTRTLDDRCAHRLVRPPFLLKPPTGRDTN